MFFSFPVDINVNILKRLPIKTIVRCTAVSKSWYSAIKTPGLLKSHFKYYKSITNPEEGDFLILSYDTIDDDGDDVFNCLVISQDSSIVREVFVFDFLANNITKHFIKIGSSCNGVICLSDMSFGGESIFLFNPSIRKLKRIPTPTLENCVKKLYTDHVYCDVGYGYDEFTDDYKVVVMFRCLKDSTWSDGTDVDEYIAMAKVYSLETNSWKLLKMIDYGDLLNISVSINNVAYWLRMSEKNDTTNYIVAFDFSAELFRKYTLPNKFHINDVRLLTYNGSLAILEFDDEIRPVEDLRVNIWIMKEYGEYSWNLVFSGVILPGKCYVLVNFTKTGKLIFWKTSDALATWDPESGEVVDLGLFSEDRDIIVEDYIESLILL